MVLRRGLDAFLRGQLGLDARQSGAVLVFLGLKAVAPQRTDPREPFEPFDSDIG